jgi:dipeptidyl aminopeptidase/acylaminoacyl peptidase
MSHPLTELLPKKNGSIRLTPDWLLSLPFNQETKPSIHWLNSNYLVFGHHALIELINIETNHQEIVTDGSNPKPSLDGKWIAFTKKIEGHNQLFLIKHDKSEVKQLTKFEKGLAGYFDYHYGYAWSPCSKYIILHCQDYLPFWQRDINIEFDDSKTSALHIDKLKVVSPRSQIILININEENPEIIATLDSSIRCLNWFPTDKKLIFMSDQIGLNYNQPNDQSWIYSLNIDNKKLEVLLEFDGLQQFLDPVISPDEKNIAFAYDAENPLFNFMTSIGLIKTQADKIITRLTNQLKLSFPKWSTDSEHIYALRDYGAYRQIYSINITGDKITQLTHSPLNIEDYSVSPDVAQLVWVGEDCHGKVIIRIANNKGQNVRDITIIELTPKEMALSEIREIDWVVPNHIEKMRGVLVLPLDYKPNTRYPLIVDIHGGGPGAHIYLRGGILVNTPLEWQLWAAKGYAVFIPEFRSSSSFGSLNIKDEMLNLVDDDISDILAGVDSLIHEGIVDSDRIAAIGHSAGARRINWLIVSTNKFKAAISKEGWADEWLMGGAEQRNLIYSIYGGHPALVPQNYQKNSSLFHVQNSKTPTLFLMGNAKMGGIDRYDTVPWLYLALKALGVESEYIQYPDEGHNFKRLANQRDALERTMAWLEKYVSNAT